MTKTLVGAAIILALIGTVPSVSHAQIKLKSASSGQPTQMEEPDIIGVLIEKAMRPVLIKTDKVPQRPVVLTPEKYRRFCITPKQRGSGSIRECERKLLIEDIANGITPPF